jgi:hypothetical protein
MMHEKCYDFVKLIVTVIVKSIVMVMVLQVRVFIFKNDVKHINQSYQATVIHLPATTMTMTLKQSLFPDLFLT